MRARLALCLLLLGILFPAAWLRQFSTSYRRTFDSIFAPEWMHILLHMALFGILAILLVITLRIPLNRRTAVGVLLAILVIGMLQEGLQLLTHASLLTRPLAFGGPVFDLGVDLAGASLGLAALLLLRKRQNKYSGR